MKILGRFVIGITTCLIVILSVLGLIHLEELRYIDKADVLFLGVVSMGVVIAGGVCACGIWKGDFKGT